VEGFENEVIEGAFKTLVDKNLIAVIMELNGSGKRYGFDEDALHEKMLQFGFQTFLYDPVHQSLISMDMQRNFSGNTLYLRDIDAVMSRLQKSGNNG